MQMRLLNAYAGYLHARILGRSRAYMAFIRDGTALTYYSDGMRIWEIADLTAKDWHSSDGYELMLQSMRDGWMMGQDDEPLFCPSRAKGTSVCATVRYLNNHGLF